MKAKTSRQRIVRLVKAKGSVSTREVVAAGIHRQILTRMVRDGDLVRVGRGFYRLPDHLVSENHGLALAAAGAPHGVICLLSALVFHGIGTQLPPEVWIAIDRRARRPALRYPPIRVIRFSGEALTSAIESHRVEGRPIRVYSVAKTLADCFKYRNKVGLDVALEALREGWSDRRFSMDELDRCARICRVERVMRPYVEALLT